MRQTLNIQVTAYVFETQRGWQKVKEKSNKSFQESNRKSSRKSFCRKQRKVNYKLKNHKRKGKTECPYFLENSKRDRTFPLLFLSRPDRYPVLLKRPSEAVTTPEPPSKECFPSSISTVLKRRLQPEVALENCNWWSTLQNILHAQLHLNASATLSTMQAASAHISILKSPLVW